MTLKNAYTVRPDEIHRGDEFCFVIKALITREYNGKIYYRIYRCPFEGEEAPDGDEINPEFHEQIVDAIFPAIGWTESLYDG